MGNSKTLNEQKSFIFTHFYQVTGLYLIAANVEGLLLGWYFIPSSPKLQPNRITDDEDKNLSWVEFHLREPLPIANKR